MECYTHGRGCEKDLIKAADLGGAKLKLDVAEKMEKEGRVSDCMRLYWAASDLGEGKATDKLAEIYKKGEVVKKNDEESERLQMILMAQFQRSDDGLEWMISKKKELSSS